jgi:HEPN domain-containing protein
MPPDEESAYPADWLAIAERDLARVERCLRDDDPEAAGFFLQQALEKFLKAFLLSRGWRLRRIHDLEALLDDAVDHDPDLESVRPVCQLVTGYYLIQRYPLPSVTSPSQLEVRDALQMARELVLKIRAALVR